MAEKMKRRDMYSLIGISTLAAIIASMCCIAPVVLVLFGLSSMSFAMALNVKLATTYKMSLITIGFAALFLGIRFYMKRKGDWNATKMTKIYNYVILGIVLFVVAYVLIHDVLIAFAGAKLGLWSVPKAFWYLP